jgi:hypothetical protein
LYSVNCILVSIDNVIHVLLINVLNWTRTVLLRRFFLLVIQAMGSKLKFF